MRSALRKAIRLGILTFGPDVTKIEGPFGVESSSLHRHVRLKDDRAREAYNRLRSDQIS